MVIAVLLGAHGVRGDCRVKSFTAVQEDAFNYGPLLAEDGAVLVNPQKVRLVKDHFIVTPELIREKEAWDALKGTLLHVPRAALPATEDDEVYIDELVGVDVFDAGGQALGTVKTVQNYGAGDLLEITPLRGKKTVLVPFTQDDVPEIDLNTRQVVVTSFDVWADESDAGEKAGEREGAEQEGAEPEDKRVGRETPAQAKRAPKAGPKKKTLKR